MKKIFLLLLIAIILTTNSFAQVFSDLPDGHWAQKVVEEMVSAGIISGYSDGTFRPAENLSKIHSLLLIARVAGINNNSTVASQYLSTYSSVLSKYSTQYKTDVAYLLGTGILKESELDMFIADSVVNEGLTREEMAILVTKVLGKEEEATGKSLIVLSFADTSSISAKAKPYVYYVSSQGYMNGTTSTNFSPKMILTRAQAAATLQRIYKLVDIKPSSSTGTTTPTTTSFLNGTITKIDTSTSSVWIKDTNGTTEEYEYDSKTEFYVGSKQKTYEAMAKNATVTVTLSNGEYITVMNISDGATVDSSTVSGTISAFNTSKKTISILKGSKTYTYTYDTSTKFTLDGKTSTYSKSLIKKYEITATVEDGTYISLAKVVKPTETITGKITAVNKSTGYVKFEDDDEDEYILMDDYLDKYDEGDDDYSFDDDTDFYYNGSSYKYSKISSTSYLYKKGYYIQITLDNDYITKLQVASKESYLKDSSTSATTGELIEVDKSYGYVVFEDDDGDEYTIMDDYLGKYDDGDDDYYFDDDTKFYYNGTSYTYSKISSTSYLYKKGYFIQITLDGDYITELRVASKESYLTTDSTSSDISDGFVFGYITDFDDDYIEIEDSGKNTYSFVIGSDCVIIERSSDDPEGDLYVYADDFDDVLDEDQEVIVVTYKKSSSKYYTSLIILLD